MDSLRSERTGQGRIQLRRQRSAAASSLLALSISEVTSKVDSLRSELALSQAGSTYAVAEAASATPLQQIEQALLGVINTPTEALALSQAGSTYAVAEAASATPLQQIEQALLGVIKASAKPSPMTSHASQPLTAWCPTTSDTPDTGRN